MSRLGPLFAHLACAMACLLACRAPEPIAEGPLTREQFQGALAGWHVALITVDTVRADRLGAFGYRARVNSPRIDLLASTGTRFLEASAPRAETWPSLATVLTGLYPHGHGVVRNGGTFGDEQPTLPKILQAAGYRTGAFLSNMCDANHSGWNERQCAGGSDGKVVRQAGTWLQGQAESDQPVFLWTHFFGAHGPYYNGGDRAQQLDPGYEGFLAPKRRILDSVMREKRPLDERDLQHLDAIYDAAIMGTDQFVGRVLDLVEQHLGLDRTLVIFLSDHGEDLYQHNEYLYHSCSVYQSSLHVPLIFQAEGVIPADARVRQPVELSDVLPTLLDLLGLSQPSCVHGESLIPYLAQPDRDGRGKLALGEYELLPISTVRSGQWKLVENPDGVQEKCFPGTPADFYPIEQAELYDLEADPLEALNRANERPELVAELSALRRQRLGGLCRTGFDFGESELSPEQIEDLRKMGYVVR